MDYGPIDAMIARHGLTHVTETCAQYLTEARLARIEHVLSGRLDSLHVAAEQPEDPHNVGAIVRSAEAFGALHVHGIAMGDGTMQGASTTQGSHVWLHTHYHASRDTFLLQVKSSGLTLAGAIMDGALTVDELPSDRPLCVVFGNEKLGLSDEMLAACHTTFRIPMVGMGESLNLSVSAAITLYGASQRRRAYLGAAGDLTGDALARMRARYYARSLEWRMLENLFP